MRPPALTHASAAIFLGDCLDVLVEMPDNSVDSIVTDPPYGLSKAPDMAEVLRHWLDGDDYVHTGSGFMGKTWDSFVPGPSVWKECLRVLKPGGHLLAFAGTRTVDLMGLAIRLAGFEMRDSIAWLYGSGFPKSMDVSKAIDKRGGNPGLAADIAAAIKAARESRGWTTGQADRHFCNGSTNWTWFEGRKAGIRPPTPADFARIVAEWSELAPWAEKVAEAEREVIGQSAHKSGIGNAAAGHYTVGGTVAEHVDITAPATPAAQQWSGWGTALKPAFEPIVVARKPLSGTVAANVLEHGTGALNIDGCRVDGQRDRTDYGLSTATRTHGGVYGAPSASADFDASKGRWPTNVVLDGGAAEELDEQSGTLRARGNVAPTKRATAIWGSTGPSEGPTDAGDSGGASRFFPVFRYQAKAPTKERPKVDGIAHPTVKPLALMRWLVRLVTPAGGTVLDTFAGSGATIEAAVQEGFYAMGIEREEDYLQLIQVRLDRVTTEETP